jgi:surface carbohydrate biosynthesis protein (TIGR04326 family)
VKSAHSSQTKAAKAIRDFNNNKTRKGSESHTTLDSFLSLEVVLKTLRDWFYLVLVCLRLNKLPSLAINASLDFTPLFQTDWNRSLKGQTAMSNALYLNLIEAAMKLLPRQCVGVYLQENQPWEFALIHAWRVAGHARLIGIPHSSVRFWDLRYFFDPRSYQCRGQNNLPMPDQVAVNGSAMMKEYLRGRYPSAQLVEVEALRYLYLEKKTTARRPTRKRSFGPLRVLVLGDYLPSNTHQMMLLLEKAFQSLPADTKIIVKPHPNCPVRTEDYPSLRMSVTMGSVSKLLPDCDVAYSSAVTSAAVDAYCAGVPVVSVKDTKTLNLSPLRSRKGVHFVSTPEELKQAFDKTSKAQKSLNRKISMFHCDKSLRRWKKIFSINSIRGKQKKGTI